MRKLFLDIYIRNVMPKLETTTLNGEAIIAKTHIHTQTHRHIYCRNYVIPKKNSFAVIDVNILRFIFIQKPSSSELSSLGFFQCWVILH